MMKKPLLTAHDMWLVFALAVYVTILSVLPVMMTRSRFDPLISEQGPFEQLSIIGWLIAAAIVVIRVRPFHKSALAFSVLFTLFAAREADWHKKFTADRDMTHPDFISGSILKIDYYTQSIAPPGEKIIAAMVAISAIILIAYVGLVITRFVIRRGGWRTRTGFWLIVASTLTLGGKFLDRLPAILAVDYGILLPTALKMFALSIEEGLEMIHPLLMAWAIWASQADGLFSGGRSSQARSHADVGLRDRVGIAES